MKIAFLHFHLKPGGVTTVIKQQVKALADSHEVLVLSGEPAVEEFNCDTACIAGLAYDHPQAVTAEPERIAAAIREVLFSKWAAGCDVLHVHNPTLAKNRNLLKVLNALREQKITLFLQVHDFAEDGRPQAYFRDEYPVNCHYGVINSRDYEILLRSGLKTEGLHQLANPITPLKVADTHQSAGGLVLYPIRAIRRKNIGEAILISIFLKRKETLAITLPPNSAADMQIYANWKRFVKRNHLRVLFEAGLKNDFPRLVQRAEFMISTSIAEGFGFSYLEAWTADKLLWGRKLPRICSDFEENSLNLDHLYTRILVPLEWIGKAALFKKCQICANESLAKFKRRLDPQALYAAFETAVEHNQVDFGILDEAFQQNVITRLLSTPKDEDRFIQLNPFLSDPGRVSDPQALIRKNKQVVLENYSPARYRKRLLEVYDRVRHTRVVQRIDKKALLDQFLNLDNINLLKWCSHAG